MAEEQEIPNREAEVTAEGTVATETPAAETVVEPPAKELSLHEKIEAMAEKVRAEKAAEVDAAKETPEQKAAKEKADADAAQVATKEAADKALKDAKTPEEKAAAEAAVKAAAGTPAFTPKLKYRVPDLSPEAQARSKNAMIEKEIPKEFQAIMKDAASEKMVHDLFTKAEGLDLNKARLEREVAEKVAITQDRDKFASAINGAAGIYRDAVAKQDYLKLDQFFKQVGVDPNVVMQYALAKAKFAALTPDEQHVIHSRLDAEAQAETLRQQSLNAETANQTLQRQMRTFMLDTRLESPAISPLAKAYDDQVGRPGAFRDEVIREGKLAYMTEKKDLSPDEAIAEVIKRYNIKAAAAPAVVTPAEPVVAQPAAVKPAAGTTVVVKRTAATIPNLQGTSSSPLAKKPNSVDDLRALHKQKLAEAAG